MMHINSERAWTWGKGNKSDKLAAAFARGEGGMLHMLHLRSTPYATYCSRVVFTVVTTDEDDFVLLLICNIKQRHAVVEAG
jgi:hypothetical protein